MLSSLLLFLTRVYYHIIKERHYPRPEVNDGVVIDNKVEHIRLASATVHEAKVKTVMRASQVVLVFA